MKNRIINLILVFSFIIGILSIANTGTTAADNDILSILKTYEWRMEPDFEGDFRMKMQISGNRVRFNTAEYDGGWYEFYSKNYTVSDDELHFTISYAIDSSADVDYYIYKSYSDNMFFWFAYEHNEYLYGGIMFKEKDFSDYQSQNYPTGRWVSDFFTGEDSSAYIDLYSDGRAVIKYDGGEYELPLSRAFTKNIFEYNIRYESDDYIQGVFVEQVNSKRIYAVIFTDETVYNDKWSRIFPDIKPSDWYYNAVNYVNNKGFITGYQNGRFGPSENIRRQDFVSILARIAGADLSQYQNVKPKLSDVKQGSYYAAAVNWAVDEGIIAGYQNGKFGVGDPITREQVAAIFYRYMGEPYVSGADSVLAKFRDRSKISPYAKTAVAWAVQNNIISGMSDGRIAAKEGASRAQIAVIIQKMDQKGMF